MNEREAGETVMSVSLLPPVAAATATVTSWVGGVASLTV